MSSGIWKILLIIITAGFYSCGEKEEFNGLKVSFEETGFCQKFWFSDADTITASKKMTVDFNIHAISESAFVDIMIDGVSLNPGQFDVYFGGELIKNKKIKLSSVEASKEVELGLRILPGSIQGKHDFFMKIGDNTLDRVNNMVIGDSIDDRIIKFSSSFEEYMNHLKKSIVWIASIIGTFLLLWFLILKKRIFPVFKKAQLILYLPEQKTLQLKGIRRFIVSNEKSKQSFFDKIFKGKILYFNPSFLIDKIEFSPGRKKLINFRGNNIEVNPFTTSLKRGYEYEFKNQEIKFTIKYI